MYKQLFFGVASLAYFSAQAAPQLQRSTFLGLIPQEAETGQNVKVASLHPGGTGSSLGLQAEDQVLTVNGKKIEDFAKLISTLSEVPAGSTLEIEVLRNDKVEVLQGVTKGRPKETGKGYQSRYGKFEWQGNAIRTITYQPDKPRADKAAVMFIQGYTCDSIDYGMVPDLTITQLLASYAQAGFTVFKMEKPGVGDSVGPLNCAEYDFDTENAAFIEGLQHFLTSNQISADRTFVFGHSLGVLHAAKIAERGLVKGVMGYGGVLKSWYEYLQDLYRVQSVRYWGTEDSQAKQNLTTVEPFLDAWLNGNRSWQQLTQLPEVKKALDSGLLPVQGQQVFQRDYEFFRSLNRHKFADIWSASQSHTLLLHGTFDIQAIDGEWAQQIADRVNNAGKVTAKALYFDGTEHALMRYEKLEDLRSAMSERTYNPGNPGEHYNGDIATESLHWMQEILKI